MAPLIDPCLTEHLGRRRIFWTTQPHACGDFVQCGVLCSIPGLEYENNSEKVEGGRTIKNNDWLRSIILNILNTRARTDVKCPAPTAVYGHWSESYRGDSMYIGTTLWNAAEKKYVRMADAVKAIKAAVTADVNKLVALGVADSVEVDATYRNSTRVDVTVKVSYTNQRHVIDLSGAYTSDTWVWH